MNQASIESYRPVKQWKINEQKAIKIHKKKNMIAMDNQPFSITNVQGSIDLLAALEPGYLISSIKYFTDTILPQAYKSLKIEI